jgi:hypothetical protein
MEKRRQNGIFHNPLEKLSKIKKLGAQGSLGRASHSRSGLRMSQEKETGWGI